MKSICVHNVVTSIQSERVIVRLADQVGEDSVRKLGGKFPLFSRARAKFIYHTDDELSQILQKLRDNGFAMMGGPAGWPPAAVFEDLRSKGTVSGEFTEIVWRDPQTPVIRRR